MALTKAEELLLVELQNKKNSVEKMEVVAQVRDEVSNDETPYVIHTPDQITVVGDATLDEKVTQDFEVTFRMPYFEVIEEYREFARAARNGTDSIVEFAVPIKNFFITSRRQMSIVSKVSELTPIIDIFQELVANKKDGEEPTNEEMYKLVDALMDNDEYLMDALYNFVSDVLKIDKYMAEFMNYENVFINMIKILMKFPHVTNEGTAL